MIRNKMHVATLIAYYKVMCIIRLYENSMKMDFYISKKDPR